MGARRLNDPPAWLRTGSGVSISRSAYSRRDPGAGWGLIRKALLSEVSILSPGVEPAFPGAQVVWIGDPQPPASKTDRTAADEILYGDGTTITRYGIGQVLGMR